MANSSIALKNNPSMHSPVADRVGYSTSGKSTATRLSHNQTALEEESTDQSVVTVLIEPNALLREGLRSVLAETRYNPVALASSLEDVGSIPVPEDGVSIFIMDAVED